ncbi:SDR family oxidoreductase [Roseomonas sp. JC162]|uniref:SDR family oxidoreductase n=1 Tax=Neoroseomonas marina TaxID=1232220 RepID=A0A848E9C5_9PROT|nr:SDR family oxidoreductase [Neoroseomonas marina]NMJ40167.1 SDR family oxidoreductase [Neoroseomonas marina]
MRILVLGAYGLIGATVAERLAGAGHTVTGFGRQVGAAALARPHIAWIAGDIAALTQPADWAPVIAGMEVVVNCAGALQDGLRDDVQAVQDTAMRALWQACAASGVRRVIQVSAAGAAPDAPTLFMRSKAAADAALAGQDLDWVVLRPGLVWAPTAYGATALLRALAAWPRRLPLPLPLAGARVQTIGVEDLADAVLDAAEGRVAARATYDLVEAESHSLAGIVTALRAWSGRPAARIVPAHSSLARIVGRACDLLGRLGWRAPLRSTAIVELARGVRGDPKAWLAAGGRPVRAFAETLRRGPATLQDRWFGGLWLMRPLLIAVLAGFWCASGAIALAQPGAAAAVLVARGMSEASALSVVLGGAVLDVALGSLVLLRRTMPFAARGMVLTSLAYLVGGTIVAPDLWADPSGPLMKVVPAMLPAAMLLALADER